MSTIRKILSNPKRYMIYAMGRLMRGSVWADKVYLKILFKYKMGKALNLDVPQTFNEKLQWMKLYNRRAEYTMMVDKYEVKKYVKDKIGEKYVIPTLGVWDKFDEIDFDSLPNQFVLKCTHDSGGLVIVKDKSELDIIAAKRKIEHCLKRNYYINTREWPYKNVKPRIIAEKYMEDSETQELRDYKFFAFDGEVKALYIASERYKDEETKFDFFDVEFNHLDFTNGHPNADVKPQKPLKFDEMCKLASLLSVGIPHARIDFYEVDGEIYFGEITFSHMSGLEPFEPEMWDYTFGNWIQLPERIG